MCPRNITLTTWDYWFFCDEGWAEDYKFWVRITVVDFSLIY